MRVEQGVKVAVQGKVGEISRAKIIWGLTWSPPHSPPHLLQVPEEKVIVFIQKSWEERADVR